MKRLLLLVSLLLVAVTAPAAQAQQNPIPNPSFENWNGVDPDGWLTNQPTTGEFRTVFQSSMAQEGASSAHLTVVDFGFGATLGGSVTTCPFNTCRDEMNTASELLFPVSERYEAICGYYKATFVGGDLLFVAADFLQGPQQPVGGTNQTTGDRCINDAAGAWTLFRRPITYIPGFNGTPSLATISIALLSGDLSSPHAGSEAFVDNLHYCEAGPALPPGDCGSGGGGIRTALLIVGDKDDLTDADMIVRNMLFGLSYVVTIMSDEAVVDTTPAGVDVVVVAGSVEDQVVDVDWTTSAVPIVALEPDLFDDMGISPFVAGTSSNTSAPVTALDLIAPDHPIANGASGTFEVFIAPHGMSFGALGAGEGTVVARADNQKAVLFAYDHNDRLADGVTVNLGRKVGFFMGEESATMAHANGIILLRNAILWATLREGEIGLTVDVETRDAEIPDAFQLGQNYPNPFNPATTIPFALSQAGHARLTVYNALGQAVTTLVDERLPGGSYTVDFEAGALPSGVYFYRLQAGGTVSSRAMLLQK